MNCDSGIHYFRLVMVTSKMEVVLKQMRQYLVVIVLFMAIFNDAVLFTVIGK